MTNTDTINTETSNTETSNTETSNTETSNTESNLHNDTTEATGIEFTRVPPTPISWEELVETCTSLSEGVFLATVQADGRPHLAWVMPGWADEKLWISTFRSSQKAVNLRNGSAVALHWPERPDAIAFSRATARLVDDPAEIAQLWDAGVLPYDPAAFFGTKDNPELLFVELTPVRATISTLDPTVPQRLWTSS